MPRNRSIGQHLFQIFNFSLLLLISAICLVPFLHIIGGSIASEAELARKPLLLIPEQVTLIAYRYIFSTNTILHSLLITVYITVFGTLVNLVFTGLLAFPLAHRGFIGRRAMMLLITFTMIFSPGIIPNYFIVKWLGLTNSLLALIFPGAISAFYLILWKNFFEGTPIELEEAAKIDGCNDLRILGQIVLPLSKPAIATFTLFYAVSHWNEFFSAILYLDKSDKWPIQVLLRQVVIMATVGVGDSSLISENVAIPSGTVKLAVIFIASFPILMIYPFLQKYFTQGALLGSIKG